MAKLYYEAPSDEAFGEMKAMAVEVWNGYTDPYRAEKLQQISHVQNIKDNFMYLFAMFDMSNQTKVVRMLSEETKQALRERMIDGGNEEYYLTAIGL